MSEQAMSPEMGSPRERAVAYLEMRQGARRGTGREKNIKTPIIPDKVRRPEPLVITVTEYEKMMDKIGEMGYEGAEKALQELRPSAYEAARLTQMGAKFADTVLTIGAILVPRTILGKAFGFWATRRFRPIESAIALGAKAQGALASSEMGAPIVNMILRGGERVQKAPEPKPAAA